MNVLNLYLKELEEEAAITRKMLERIPKDKYDWQPHTKSMNIVTLANHIAELPYWVNMSLNMDVLDFAASPYQPPTFRSSKDLIKFMDKGMEEATGCLTQSKEEVLEESWVLKTGDEIHWETTKGDALRMSVSQMIHHRAQLGVYLRLLDVPIPGSYGPSADEA
ncbi:MAG: DinB family protein [Cyclobacteriaceae bacterium]